MDGLEMIDVKTALGYKSKGTQMTNRNYYLCQTSFV